MDQVVEALPESRSPTRQTLSRKSWTAYIRLIIYAAILFGIVVPLTWAKVSVGFSLVCLALSVAWILYEVWLLTSYELYCDEQGVWVYSGVLPWARGSNGVRWRDLDQACFYPNLFSWVFRSYRLNLRHRYTKTSEIWLSHMSRGDRAVAAINALHHRLLQQSALS